MNEVFICCKHYSSITPVKVAHKIEIFFTFFAGTDSTPSVSRSASKKDRKISFRTGHLSDRDRENFSGPLFSLDLVTFYLNFKILLLRVGKMVSRDCHIQKSFEAFCPIKYFVFQIRDPGESLTGFIFTKYILAMHHESTNQASSNGKVYLIHMNV